MPRLLKLAIVLLVWWGLCWLGTQAYSDHQSKRVYQAESAAADHFVADLAKGFERIVTVRVGMPKLLARDPTLQQLLHQVGPVAAGAALPYEERQRRWTQDPALAQVNRRFQMDASDLGLNAIGIVDTAGNCIAASNADTDKSFVGVNYADRDYFSELMAGQSGYRITVGKQHGSIGIAFFAPIMDHGRVIGGLMSRIDLLPYGNWLKAADAFLTDRNGVVVLSTDPTREMYAVTDAPVRRLDASTQQAQYHRTDFALLDNASWGDTRFPQLRRMKGHDAPVLWRSHTIASGNEPIIHLLRPLPQLIELQNQRALAMWSTSSMGTLLILFALLASLRRQEQQANLSALAQQEQEFRSLAENTPTPIVRYDRHCRRVYANSALARMLNQPLETLIGHTPTDGWPRVPEHATRMVSGILSVCGSRKSTEVDMTHIDSHGKQRHYLIRLVPECTQDGQVQTVLALTFEVTSIREAERQMTQFVANFPGFVYTFQRSIEGHDSFPFASPGIEILFGLQPLDVRNDARPLYALVAHEDVCHVRNVVIQSGQTMTPAQAEFRICRAGQPERWAEFRASPMRQVDGSSVWHGIMLDITERKRDELARQAVLAEAERLTKLRGEFLAHLSHELRTPLNGILGHAQLLQRDPILSRHHAAELGVIHHCGEHLMELIDNTLDLTRMDAGRLVLSVSNIALPSFLHTLTDIVGITARNKGLSFSCELATDLPSHIQGDARRLRQVLLNLLTNAIKFTPRGRVVLRVQSLAPARLEFAVEDTGIGIAPAELEAIFQPFEQVTDVLHRYEGTGLGLTISRQLVRFMGGDILVQSHPGVGSRFSFELDMPAADRAAPLQQNPYPPLAQHPVPDSEPSAPLLAPPPEEMRVLHHLAQRGNMRDIIQCAEHIDGLHPGYQAFAAR
ncbi:MAG: multi-sensor hybrid histidine kinase, partial [Comamonadaceae bacterium]